MAEKREHYIVDGYNVIHAGPELRGLAAEELAEARDRLVHRMAEFGAYEGYDMTIVFDALFTNDEAREDKRDAHLSVIYTAAGETADSYIERLAYESVRAGREVHVVTSDGAEQTVILGAGAYRLPPRELWRRVRKCREKMRREYLFPYAGPIARSAVSDRLDRDTAARLDQWRRRRD